MAVLTDLTISAAMRGAKYISVTWSRFEKTFQALNWTGSRLSFGYNYSSDDQGSTFLGCQKIDSTFVASSRALAKITSPKNATVGSASHQAS